MTDKIKKGRHKHGDNHPVRLNPSLVFGEKNPAVKLSENQVLNIRKIIIKMGKKAHAVSVKAFGMLKITKNILKRLGKKTKSGRTIIKTN